MQMKMSGSDDKGVKKYHSNMELKKSLIEVMGFFSLPSSVSAFSGMQHAIGKGEVRTPAF